MHRGRKQLSAPCRLLVLVIGAVIGAALFAWLRGHATEPLLAMLGVLPLAAAGVAIALARDARVRRREREADDRLQLLVDRTCIPDITLLEVVDTQWASGAGQRATTVDVATGAAECMWLAQAHVAQGALILVLRAGQTVTVLDWMPPNELQAAYRYRSRKCQAGLEQRQRGSLARSSYHR